MLQEVQSFLDKIESELIDSSDKKERAFSIFKLFINHEVVKQNDSSHSVMPLLSTLNFREMRKEKGFTLREVENITGYSNSYLSQIETGKVKSPSYNVVKTLYDLYSK